MSFMMSASRRNFWGSLAMPEDASQAKRIVARRPVESCTTVRRTAPVAVEVASPTPTPKVSLRSRRGNLGGRLCWREGGPLDFN